MSTSSGMPEEKEALTRKELEKKAEIEAKIVVDQLIRLNTAIEEKQIIEYLKKLGEEKAKSPLFVEKLRTQLSTIMTTEETKPKYSTPQYDAVYNTLITLSASWPRNSECPLTLSPVEELENKIITSDGYQFDYATLQASNKMYEAKRQKPQNPATRQPFTQRDLKKINNAPPRTLAEARQRVAQAEQNVSAAKGSLQMSGVISLTITAVLIAGCLALVVAGPIGLGIGIGVSLIAAAGMTKWINNSIKEYKAAQRELENLRQQASALELQEQEKQEGKPNNQNAEASPRFRELERKSAIGNALEQKEMIEEDKKEEKINIEQIELQEVATPRIHEQKEGTPTPLPNAPPQDEEEGQPPRPGK